MELTVYWTAFAENELNNIFQYYKKHANPNVARKIINGIVLETVKLKLNHHIGQVEELLAAQQNQNFRYLLYKNYKIVYRINIDAHLIEVADVFDTRQNPNKINQLR